MKPPAFTYHAPETLGEALDVLAGTGEEGKVLAGGQSLVPLLNMRLAVPEHLVDINRIAELDTVEAAADGVRVGALARQARLERDEAAGWVLPLLRQALRLVAHPAIRNRGTAVGSLVHADPAGELTAVLALTRGTVELARRGARRTVPAGEFFTGVFETCMEPDELAVAAFFPAPPPRTGTAFVEVARRHGDYALAGVAAAVTLDDDLRVSAARTACIGVGPTPLALDVSEAAGGRPPGTADWVGAAALAGERARPGTDIHASAEYRRHLVGVLTERALREATGAAFHGGTSYE